MADPLDNFAPDVDLTAEPEAPTPEPIADVQLEAPEPKSEEKPGEKPEPKSEEKPQKLVPLEALHESRIKEREWREKAAQVEREAQERFKKLEERLERLVNPPPPVPNFTEDPAGHLKYQVEATQAEIAAIRQANEDSRKMTEAQAFEQQIATSTQAAEAAFAKDHPDYLAAVQHLQTIADRNMQMLGLDDPVARQQQIRRDAMAMSLKALQMGKSPAEVAYQLAINYGYKAAQAPDPVAAEAAKKQIATLQAGTKAGAASMPTGGTKQTALTLAALEQMDDDDFNKLVEDDTQWKKLIRQMV